MSRPLASDKYPWYDSGWLARFEQAKATLARERPEALRSFVEAFKILETRPDFQVRRLARVFDDSVMTEIRRVVAGLRPVELNADEGRLFGRFLLRRHPYFNALQEQIVALVEDAAGEKLECSYNFLSLYTGRGICPVHMDSPEAKWTLDLCVQQHAPWPIYLSQVRPWPRPDDPWPSDGWAEAIVRAPENRFTPYELEPGEAIVFSGSSQWHYRDRMPGTGSGRFCDLLFFHFVPAGTRAIVNPPHWAEAFGLPELASLS